MAPTCCFWQFTFSLRSDLVPFAGDSLERSYLFYDRPSTLSSNAPAFRGQSRLSGFCCALGHRATTIRACAHMMKTVARYQLRAQGRSFVPGPNKFGGITGRSLGERPHYGIAGESPGKRDLMWTQGLFPGYIIWEGIVLLPCEGNGNMPHES